MFVVLVLARSARTGSESSGKKGTSARKGVLKASVHGVVGATEGLLRPAFALPTSVRLEPGREGVWIVWIMLGAQSCPEDLVLEDRTRRTGPRQASIKTILVRFFGCVRMCVCGANQISSELYKCRAVYTCISFDRFNSALMCSPHSPIVNKYPDC